LAASAPLGDPNLFIALLTAQLQAQDPLNPMSPQDMVNQLTQVSSLQQLISINQTLTNLSTGTLPKTTQSTNPTGSTQ
jgi:flagellar basal-body rod modification protein FlgD